MQTLELFREKQCACGYSRATHPLHRDQHAVSGMHGAPPSELQLATEAAAEAASSPEALESERQANARLSAEVDHLQRVLRFWLPTIPVDDPEIAERQPRSSPADRFRPDRPGGTRRRGAG